MNHKNWQAVLPVLLPSWLIVFSVLPSGGSSPRAQTKATSQSSKSSANPSSAKWVENKILVRVDSPYLSDSGNLVLAYTVTNKTGQDIELDFTENPPTSLKPHEPTRVFLKLKDPDSYSQDAPKDHFLYLVQTLLAADLPVSFHVVLSVSSEDKPSWFSSESAEERLWRLLKKKLGNTDSIAIFIPDRQLKITLPVPSGPRK